MLKSVSAGILLALLAGLAPMAQANDTDIAVIIGNKSYAGNVPDVLYAHRDADAFERYAQEVLGIPARRILSRRDQTLVDFNTLFGTERVPYGHVHSLVSLLTAAEQSRANVYVYYSGHGVPGLKDLNDARGYLLPVNANPNSPHASGYPLDLMLRALGELPVAATTVFLDSCFSGSSEAGTLITEASPHLGVAVDVSEVKRGVTVLTAAKGTQFASWDREAQHGLFTAHLIRGLYGEGDLNRDGTVTAAEIHQYLRREMSSCALTQLGRLQVPDLVGYEGRVLARLTNASLRAPVQQGLCIGRTAVSPQPAAPDGRLETAGGTTRPPDPPSAEEVEAGLGLTRSGWRSVQEALNSLGHNAGGADGVPGRNTRSAIARWQRSAGRQVVEYGFLTAEGHAALLEAAKEAAPRVQPAVGIYPDQGASGRTWRDSVTGMEFVWIPGGTFEMGCGSWDGDCSDDEKPVHPVTLDGYWLGKYEVTQGEWRRVMGNNPSRFKNGDNHPVEQVSWNDVQDFIRRLNSQSSATFRLPSEAEWEYACRSAGRPEKFSGSSSVGSVAWYGSNSGGKTHPVGGKSANGLGLHDMSGNVWEWVQDWYDSDAYSQHSSRNPMYTSGGSYRVTRGGSWSGNARYSRCAYRSGYAPGLGYNDQGFRLLRSS